MIDGLELVDAGHAELPCDIFHCLQRGVVDCRFSCREDEFVHLRRVEGVDARKERHRVRRGIHDDSGERKQLAAKI